MSVKETRDRPLARRSSASRRPLFSRHSTRSTTTMGSFPPPACRRSGSRPGSLNRGRQGSGDCALLRQRGRASSHQAAAHLERQGYRDVAVYPGGKADSIEGWTTAGEVIWKSTPSPRIALLGLWGDAACCVGHRSHTMRALWPTAYPADALPVRLEIDLSRAVDLCSISCGMVVFFSSSKNTMARRDPAPWRIEAAGPG